MALIAQSSSSSPEDIYQRLRAFVDAQTHPSGMTPAFNRMLAQAELLHMSHPDASSMSLRITEQHYLEFTPVVGTTTAVVAAPAAASSNPTANAARKKKKQRAATGQTATTVVTSADAAVGASTPTASTTTPAQTTPAGPSSQRAPPCFHFFSKEGCTRRNCSFAHGAVPSKGSQAHKLLRENLASRGLTPAAALDN
jgi:hypothetical protein